jgi:hypothetical protein
MIRLFTLGSALCLLMAATPANLFAQISPAQSNPYGSDTDPRLRRAYREKAVGIVGTEARDFVESMGDEAVAAIFACSKPVAIKLAAFHMSGDMGKLPRPRDLLRVIAQRQHGDDVALWAMRHAGELTDTDSFDAYLNNPLDYALGLKKLEAGAAEARAGRLNHTAMKNSALTPDEKLSIVIGAGFLLVLLALLWRRRQSAM